MQISHLIVVLRNRIKYMLYEYEYAARICCTIILTSLQRNPPCSCKYCLSRTSRSNLQMPLPLDTELLRSNLQYYPLLFAHFLQLLDQQTPDTKVKSYHIILVQSFHYSNRHSPSTSLTSLHFLPASVSTCLFLSHKHWYIPQINSPTHPVPNSLPARSVPLSSCACTASEARSTFPSIPQPA